VQGKTKRKTMNGNCHVIPIERIITPEEQENTEQINLMVRGMGCSNCAMRVRNGLFALKGVVYVEVAHSTAIANITFNPELVTLDNLFEAVANAGNDGRHSYRVTSVLTPQTAALRPNRIE
jgi:copper chaperone CopZ